MCSGANNKSVQSYSALNTYLSNILRHEVAIYKSLDPIKAHGLRQHRIIHRKTTQQNNLNSTVKFLI